MKKMIAFAAPILPGKTENFKTFVNELKENWATEFTESRKKLNLHERTYLQTTPQGDFVIVTLEGNDPENAIKKLSTLTDPFSMWFLAKVKEIHGIDMKDMTNMPTMVLDTEKLTTTTATTLL